MSKPSGSSYLSSVAHHCVPQLSEDTGAWEVASQTRAFIILPSFPKLSRKKLGHAARTVCWFTQQWQGKKVPAGVERTKHARFTSCEGDRDVLFTEAEVLHGNMAYGAAPS